MRQGYKVLHYRTIEDRSEHEASANLPHCQYEERITYHKTLGRHSHPLCAIQMPGEFP